MSKDVFFCAFGVHFTPPYIGCKQLIVNVI